MIPFKEICDLADKIRDKVNASVCVEVEYWTHNGSGNTSIKYRVATVKHQAVHENLSYQTAQELIDGMNRILEPIEDEGVSV